MLFEAQIQCPLLYQQLVSRLNRNVYFSNIALSPFDCMSVGYFLVFALRAGRLSVRLNSCIELMNTHALGLLLGELSRHAEAYPAGVLQGVTELSLRGNKIGDKGIADIANSLRTNTTISSLDVFDCGISDIGVQSLAEAIASNGSIRVERLDISNNDIGDNGIAHIATALQMNTTIKFFSMSNCGITNKGAESLARVLAVNMSLEHIELVWNYISDTGVAHISTALCVNNSLEWLEVGGDTIRDAAVLLLVDALKTNTSLEGVRLHWSSTHPDYTLKLMAEIFKESNLKSIYLGLYMACSRHTTSSKEEVEEWLQQIKVKGKELIMSLEDNRHLIALGLDIFSRSSLSAVELEATRTSLEAAVASVNSARSEKSYCALKFSCIFD